MNAVWEARKKIIGVGALVLLVMLMMNINSRLNEYFHLTTTRDELSTEVGYLRQTKIALETQVAYATSDQAVEDWARRDAHMARPGDQVIIPVTPVNQTPEPQIQVTPTPQVVENWEVWWALFFGS